MGGVIQILMFSEMLPRGRRLLRRPATAGPASLELSVCSRVMMKVGTNPLVSSAMDYAKLGNFVNLHLLISRKAPGGAGVSRGMRPLAMAAESMSRPFYPAFSSAGARAEPASLNWGKHQVVKCCSFIILSHYANNVKQLKCKIVNRG